MKKLFFTLLMNVLRILPRSLGAMGIALLTLSGCENHAQNTAAAEGIARYQKGDYATALPLLEKAAQSGHAEAAWYLGEMYHKGQGTQKEGSTACRYFVQASHGGYKEAYLRTGLCYFVGAGVQQDFSEALRWGKKAAENTDEIQQTEEDKELLARLMAALYVKGKGTLQDFSEAAKWIKKTAEMGDALSQGMLAFFYYSGQGVLMNDAKARYWAEKAAAQGDSMGEFILGMLYQFRQEPPNMPKAISWYEKSAAQKNAAAQQALAMIYEEGLGVKPDLAKAHDYYRQAVKNGKRDYLVQALEEFEKRHGLDKSHSKPNER